MSLNARMVAFARERLATMGLRESGLYNYYAHLAAAGTMLRPEDIAVSDYIDTIAPGPVLELCAGAAQLGHLLSLRGHDVTAVEIDPRRHAFAVALGEHVGSTCSVILARWQDLPLSEWRTLVTINAVTSQITVADTALLLRHGSVILRPRQFGAGIPERIPGMAARQVFDDVYHYTAR